ncbi:putative rhomboid family membrane protein [Rhypophila decipiens]
MAANDYYNQKPLPYSGVSEPPGSYGGQSAAISDSSRSYNAPTPTPQQPYPEPYPANDRPRPAGPSPFETVFDDHVYPASTHQTPNASQYQLSQQDTGYRGLGGAPSDEMAYNHPTDDIPLQEHGNQRHAVKDQDGADHVYDAPQRQKSRKGRVRFGELGMLGSNSKKIPFVVYTFTIIQIAVFIAEIVKNATLTGSPIMTRPQFNPMIGPSTYVLINMGALFVPCMQGVKEIEELKLTEPLGWPCPNSTTDDGNSPMNKCTLSQLCGFGGVPEPFYNGTVGQNPHPDQWFRLILPIFMHAGLIHIGFNLLLQVLLGRDMERAIGSIRFFLVYMSSGIFGFLMGANFGQKGMPSTGASGALFGIFALLLLDLFYSWKDRRSPGKDLAFLLVSIVISLVLGLLPGLDNFSHVGGFLMGLALGISVLHSPNSLRRRMGEDVPYSHVDNGFLSQGTPPSFFKNPVGFFKGRKPLWWVWWGIRAAALVLVLVVFIVLLNNFYIYKQDCSWCKYISCLPVSNWCDSGALTFNRTLAANNPAPTNQPTTPKRDEMMFDLVQHFARLPLGNLV